VIVAPDYSNVAGLKSKFKSALSYVKRKYSSSKLSSEQKDKLKMYILAFDDTREFKKVPGNHIVICTPNDIKRVNKQSDLGST